MDHLGDGLVFEILKRLAPEDLSELLLVCKKWYGVINHPYFMKTNLLRHQHSDNMLVQSYDEEEGVYEASIYSVSNGQLGYPKVIRYLNEWKIQGSCNGLLLVQHCYQLATLAVTNPVTKFTVTLPPCEPDHMEISSFAFLFVPTAQTYHVIHIFETKATKGPQCRAIALKYNSSEEELAGLHWTQLWGGDYLGHTVRCSENPICLSNGIVIWKLPSREQFLAWDVGAGQVHPGTLPGEVVDDDDYVEEYFLINKAGSLAHVDYYNDTGTVVRIHTLNWGTREWTGLWGMSLLGFENLVGYQVDAISPYFISKNGIIMIFSIDGHVFHFNSDIGTRVELGGLSGKDIVFCGNHVKSIVSLKKALDFTSSSEN